MFQIISSIISALVSALVSYFAKKREASAAAKEQQAEQTLKDIEVKNEVDTRINSMSDADAINELRDKWQR